MDRTTLEPIEPETAVELYHESRREDATASTQKAHRYRLNHFIRWCDEESITNMNELTGRRLYEYRLWRTNDGGLNVTSIRTQMATLRAFIKFCEAIEAVTPHLHEDITLPALKDGEGVRSVMLEAERASEILAHLRRFEYASRKHIVFELLWTTAIRTGGLHSLDVEDLDDERKALRVRHRPETGTSLKNGKTGERMIALSDGTYQTVRDWIDHNRPDSVDEYGRNPLIATKQGRILKGNIRDIVYRATRPCFISKECPCGKADEFASKCDDSVSPHAMRRGSITHHLKQDVPKQVVADRANVSPDVLDRHYNQMTEEEQMEQRRGYLNNI